MCGVCERVSVCVCVCVCACVCTCICMCWVVCALCLHCMRVHLSVCACIVCSTFNVLLVTSGSRLEETYPSTLAKYEVSLVAFFLACMTISMAVTKPERLCVCVCYE